MSDQNQANTENTNPTENTAPTAPVSRREKLAAKYQKDLAKYNELLDSLKETADEIAAIDALANVGEGSDVLVALGKGETARTVAAKVIGVKVDEDGAKTYKVQYGTGFDADIAVVKAGKISLPTASAPAEQPQAAE